jgi:predicted TIM-barrel fold metal-dependent hydrolase
MNTSIVDAHLHVWEMPSNHYPWRPLRNMWPEQPAPVQFLVDTMTKCGVSQAIIVQPSNYGYDHRYVTACLERYPQLFGGVALLDFRAPDAPKKLEALHSLGFRGVRLFLYHESDLSWVSPGIDPVMKKVAELGMIVTVFGPWNEFDRIRRLAHRHPRVRFVIDHLGHPDIVHPETWKPVLQLAELPSIYIKVSDFPTLSRQPYPYADVFPFVREVRKVFTPQRMMWGSNFPQALRSASYGDLLALIDASMPDLGVSDKERVVGGTAAELWALRGAP